MSNLDIKLSQVEQAKADIKQALIEKEVDMTDVPFTEYASKIGELGGTDLSTCQTLEFECSQFGNENLKEQSKEQDVTGLDIQAIVISGSCNRWTGASTKSTHVLYGSTDNGTSYEELLRIERTDTSINGTYGGVVNKFDKKYNKLKITANNSSNAYGRQTRAIVYYK